MKLILGIESSCDDTAAALVRGVPGMRAEILSSKVAGQEELHRAYGGVVPEIAARAHAEKLDIVIASALDEAGVALSDLDAIAVTAGPGLIGGLLAGVMTGKALARVSGKPLIGVNHLAGHALTPRMTDGVAFPYIMLLVSGGHCQFLHVTGPDSYTRLGSTIDDAPGEAFDKTAKLLGLPYPGGPAVEAEAHAGDPTRFAFPRPLMNRPGCDMSFSGLKTALRRARDVLIAEKGGITRQDRADLCAGFQAAVADVLAGKTRQACRMARAPLIAIAGGVAANKQIRAALEGVAAEHHMHFLAPPLKYCTDNGAMIAWAGLERLAADTHAPEIVTARPRWPLDEQARPLLGAGKRGVKA